MLRNNTGMLQFKRVLEVRMRSDAVVGGMGGLANAAGRVQECYKNARGLLLVCIRNVAGIMQECSKNAEE